jgi:DNA polymerase-3 subunit delta
LEKIENLSKSRKNISFEDLVKLINLNEDFSVSELIDNCLAQNKKKTFIIINENNFNNDDSILIIRTFINKLKRILSLSKEYELTNNIDKTINEAKPSIFWKDKDIVKKQVLFWPVKNIESLIVQINEIELKIKKNSSNAINIILDFIIKNCSQTSN